MYGSLEIFNAAIKIKNEEGLVNANEGLLP